MPWYGKSELFAHYNFDNSICCEAYLNQLFAIEIIFICVEIAKHVELKLEQLNYLIETFLHSIFMSGEVNSSIL